MCALLLKQQVEDEVHLSARRMALELDELNGF